MLRRPRLFVLCRTAMSFYGKILLLAFLLLLPTLPAQAADLFVAPTGDDSQAGTRENPLATLEGARNKILALKKEGGLPAGGVTVWLSGGDYVLAQGFKLTSDDSGTADAPIVYRAIPGERARLLGGRRVHGWKPVADPGIADRLDAQARKKVVQADLRALGIQEFGRLCPRGFGLPRSPAHSELFFDGQPMTLARWPNEGQWDTIADIPPEAAMDDGHGGTVGDCGAGFLFSGDRPRRWRDLAQVWIHGFWAWDWANSYQPIASLDVDRRLIKAGPLQRCAYRKGQRFFYLNVLEELDQPGEWFLDHDSGIVYLWPPKPLDACETTISLLDQPMVSLDGASHITLRGLTFECARGDAVRVKGGGHCRLAGCSIRLMGNYGVIVEGGADHTVIACDVENTGDGGVKLAGGDRQTLTPAGHLIQNCSFRKQGRWSKCYVPAIEIEGVGIRAANNLIQEHPHCAIQFVGNDHCIELNHIHHVALETGDVGAIYTGRNWTYRGNVVRHNFLHHTGGVGIGSNGVYMDDCVSGTTIVGNVFYKVPNAVFLGGGRDHHVENNIFVDCSPAVWIDGRGLSKRPVWHNMVYDLMKLELYAVPQELYRDRYPAIRDLDKYYAQDNGVPPENNLVARNICVGGKWLDLDKRVPTALNQIAENYIGPDPGFASIEQMDFRLRQDSPAWKIGFKEIPWERIGLFRDEYRRDPSVEAAIRP